MTVQKAVTTADDGWERTVRREQLAILVRQTPFLAVASICNALFLAILVHENASPAVLWGWLAAVTVVALYPLRAWLRGRHAPSAGSGSKRSIRHATIQASIAGLVWATAALLFGGAVSAEKEFLLYLLLVGMAAGGSVTLSAVPSAATAYSFSIGLVVLPHIFSRGETSHTVLGAWLVLLFMVSSFASRSILGATIKALRDRSLEAEQKALYEGRFRDFARAASDWFWEADSDGRLVEIWSENGDRLAPLVAPGAGCSLQDLELLQEDERGSLQERFERHERIHHALCMLTDAAGARRRVSVNALPIVNSAGEVVGYRGTFTDMTGILAARERADQAEAVLADAIEAMSEGFILFDANDRVVTFNSKHSELFPSLKAMLAPGVSYESMLRAQIAAGLVDEAQGREEEYIAERTLKTREPRGRVVQRFADGTVIRLNEKRTSQGGLVAIRTDITDLVRERERAEESRRNLQILAETAPVALSLSIDGRYIFANRRLHDLLGLPPGSLIGRTVGEFYVVPEERNEVIRQLRETGRVHDFETSLQPIDGSPIRVSVNAATITYEGKACDFAGVLDITDRHNAVRALQDSEQRFRDYAEASSDWFWEMDEELRFTYLSPNAMRMSSLPIDFFYGKTRRDILGSNYDRATWDAHLQQLDQHQSFRDFTYPYMDPQRGQLWIRTSGMPTFDLEGRFTGYRGVAADVTELVDANDAMRRNEEHLRSIIDNSPSAIALKDLDGRILVANRKLAERYGREPAELLGLGTFDLDQAEQAIQSEQQDQEVRRSRRAIEREYDITTAAGESQTLIVTKFPIFNEAGEITGVGSIGNDVTERRRLQAQLAQSQKMDAVGQLSGGIAHDFNNLLGVVVGNLDLLAQDLTDKPDQQRLLQRAIDAAERGGALTQRLLSFSRQQSLLPRPIRLNELIQGLIELLRRTLGSNIEIETSLEPELGTASVDPGQLEAAIINLAINARDAMPDGGKLTIRTTAFAVAEDSASQSELPAGNYLAVTVDDTGGGMTPDILERCCQPFFTTKEVGKGSGLGLSMVYGFAKQSGGALQLDSQPGNGTSITILLPQDCAEIAVLPEREHVVPQGNGQTVLVVEDSAELRQVAVDALRRMGYRTRQAENAREALALLETHPEITILFSDVNLPGSVSGFRLGEEVRRKYPFLHILLTTGYAAGAAVKPATGEFALLGKPYRVADLARKLAEVSNEKVSA